MSALPLKNGRTSVDTHLACSFSASSSSASRRCRLPVAGSGDFRTSGSRARGPASWPSPSRSLIMRVFPHGHETLHAGLHLVTYGLMFYFLAANLHIPGLWLIGLGGAANAMAIAANNGVMPAHPNALATAGILQVPGEFANSAAVRRAEAVVPRRHLRAPGRLADGQRLLDRRRPAAARRVHAAAPSEPVAGRALPPALRRLGGAQGPAHRAAAQPPRVPAPVDRPGDLERRRLDLHPRRLRRPRARAGARV